MLYGPVLHNFGPDTYLLYVNAGGDGSATITNSYHRSIEIHSPENITYTTNSVPLNFTFHNSSVISWIGYSLDDQSNVTISGNTIITDLANGLHNLIVYGNDTNGYMSYSDIVYFTVQTQPVGGIYIPVNKLELLAPYIVLATTIILATVATALFVKYKKKKITLLY